MRRFGLIGKTLKHSFSKTWFTKKFEEEGIPDCSYENFELQSIEQLPGLIQSNSDLAGVNITIPYKEAVCKLLDQSNELVQEIGACNCIKIENGILSGYNTDALAFQRSLSANLQPEHQCALVLGSGGASKAIQFALKKMNIDFLVVTRNKKDQLMGYEDLGRDVMDGHQIIINTTPLGTYPNVDQDPSIPYEWITTQHLLFDLVYNPPKTKFLREGEKKGARIVNGYEMLVGQAEESWRIWNESKGQ
jgi:shikimate dehydrogenase